MKIAILGYGDQGRSAYEYWGKPENTITICDQNATLSLPENVDKQLGDDYLANLSQFDLIVRSPSVHPKDIVAANNPQILDKVTTVTDEFIQVCPTKNIVGVTGTKGKGTTSTLIARMIESTGKVVHLGGNIGIPPLDMLHDNIEAEDWVVLELANFQLIDLKHSPHLAVCLMIEPEHMNWHTDFEEYLQAKQQLFTNQTADDIAVYYAQNPYSVQVATASKGTKIPYLDTPGAVTRDGGIWIDDQEICKVSEVKLLGAHNLQNICAALTAAWQVTKDTDALKAAITSFTGLAHRLEFVRELEDVKYYDDSFGTTPSTAIVAMQAFEEPKVIILGGSDKDATYDELAQTVKDTGVRSVVLIGATAPAIQASLEQVGFTDFIQGGTTMDEIVDAARTQSRPGDIVLLSTACASFGLFSDYKDRGRQFKQVVQALV